MWMTASACSSAAKSGTASGPQAMRGPGVYVLARREHADQMATGAEKRRQLRQDPAGPARQDEAKPASLADPAMPG